MRHMRYRSVGGPAPSGIAIAAPVTKQVFRRVSGVGTITITGTYTGTAGAIEASFNGGAYATIAASPTGGTFSGTLTNQTPGSGTLTVRAVYNTSVSATVASVGIGLIFIIAGQSNAVGQGDNNQSISGQDVRAYSLAGAWVMPAVDPLDQYNISQTHGGTYWLPLGARIAAREGCPVVFVPRAVNATGIASWQPGQADYVAITTANTGVGGATAVLWHQGEADAGSMSNADYETNFGNIEAQLLIDCGIPIIPCMLEAFYTLNPAFLYIWNNQTNARRGADLEIIQTGLHLTTDDMLSRAAILWDVALEATLLGRAVLLDGFEVDGNLSGRSLTTGGTWTVNSGTWSTSGGYALKTATNGSYQVASAEASVADATVQAEIPVASGNILGVVFRLQDASNYWVALIAEGASPNWAVYHVTAGSLGSAVASGTAILTSQGPGPLGRNVVTVICSGTSIKAYLNGGDLLDITSSALQSATKFGLCQNTASSGKFDNFQVTVP